jgi:hypothetical protein
MAMGKNRREGISSAFEEHGAILDSLERKNRIAFQYHMNRHLEAGLSFI